MTIHISQQVQKYWTDDDFKESVNDLCLRQAAFLPRGLEWDGLRAFHNRLQEALAVRSEYSILLIDVWEAVWGPALSAAGFHKAIPIDEMEVRPSAKFLWNDGLWKSYYNPQDESTYIEMFVEYCGPDDGFDLLVGVFDKDGNPIWNESLDLGTPWEPHLDDDVFDGYFIASFTEHTVAPDSNEFDPTKMQAAAAAALAIFRDTPLSTGSSVAERAE